jgi:hypothetical protein
MVDNVLFSDLLLGIFLGLGVILYERWVCNRAATGPTTRKPATPLRKHSQEPQPFPGLVRKPPCAACEPGPAPAQPLPLPPPLLATLPGRPRQVDTAAQYCPTPRCAS